MIRAHLIQQHPISVEPFHLLLELPGQFSMFIIQLEKLLPLLRDKIERVTIMTQQLLLQKIMQVLLNLYITQISLIHNSGLPSFDQRRRENVPNNIQTAAVASTILLSLNRIQQKPKPPQEQQELLIRKKQD
jgi:hypothetical protein